MIYSIGNGQLSASVDEHGAQLRSVKATDETEYLWQGDSKYWKDSAPVLFPYIARLYGGGYIYCGKKYEMGIHGFAAHSEFEAVNVGPDNVTMELHENEMTLSQYPFHFTLAVTYAVSGATLSVTYDIENRDEKPMPFAVGGHPGFNVPFCRDTKFEDYSLTFSEKCVPDRIGFTDKLFLSGENRAFRLENGKTIRLSHDLFDADAIILQNMAKSVTLGCDKSSKRLTVSYPDMPYLGIWHMPYTDAPYVCIEPWTSLPSRHEIVEEITWGCLVKRQPLKILPGSVKESGKSV